MKQVTRQEVVDYLNTEIIFTGSILRFKKSDIDCSIDIILSDKFLAHSMLSKTEEFYDWVLEKLKKKYKIKDNQLNWNNTGTIFSIWIDSNTNFMEK